MFKKLGLFTLMLFTFKLSYAQNEALEESKIEHVKNIISVFKKQNIDSISKIIYFPLDREYPLTSIKNDKEFTERFNEVFDSFIIARIANSKIEDWSEVGWRGIMLEDGLIWIESYEGKIIAVNHQSELEKQLRNTLIAKEKENLHASLKVFENPICRIKSKNYLIRIDEISKYNYRYASWKVNENESSKPDLILTNGEIEFQGSGGNHLYIFFSGIYTYKVYGNVIGAENDPDFTLVVEKNGIIISTEDATLVFE